MPTNLDDVLLRLKDFGPEFGSGLSNHAPMVAETLVKLGRPESIDPWLSRYKHVLLPMPQVVSPIRADNWQVALGDINRFADWREFFRSELLQQTWTMLLNQWVDRLSPGIVAAAMHGVIRTGHAVRNLQSNENSAPALDELASGLAYWAARYQQLRTEKPGSAHRRSSTLSLLNELGFVPDDDRASFPLITQELESVEKLPEFPGLIYLLKEEATVEQQLSILTVQFAQVFVDNCWLADSTIGLIHAVTGPTALRYMLPFLEDGVGRKAVMHSWHAAAALYSRYGSAPPAVGSIAEKEWKDDELIDRSIATDDEHAIKFTEACLSESTIAPNKIFSQAAAKCCRLLSRTK